MKTADRGEQALSTRERLQHAVTDRMIAALEQGTVPWQKPWGAMGGWPRKMAGGGRYEGVNVLLLGMTAAERGYTSPWWGGIKTINALGGAVMAGQSRKNSRGATTVVFGGMVTKESDEIDPQTGEPQNDTHPVFGARQVFNAEQCEGLPARFYAQPSKAEILAGPQAVIDGYLSSGGPRWQEVPGDRAYYRTDGSDTIVMPLRSQFRSTGGYYSTWFHELTHSTGWLTRLGRTGIVNFDHFGTGQYAAEELVAEMGAPLLVAELDIDEPGLFENSVAYNQSWLGKLQNDRSLVMSAASQAYAAVELITEPTRQAEARLLEQELEAGA